MLKNTIIILAILCSMALSTEKRAMTVEDLWAMHRITDARLSPDGQWLVYSLSEYDMKANDSQTNLWLISTKGGKPRQLTTHSAYDGHPRWTPDGKAVSFLSYRNGSTQIHTIPMQGGEARQLTESPVDIHSFIWSPTGDKLAFTAYVYPDTETLKATAERDKKKQESNVKARIIDDLLFRSWNRWTNGKRTHVFVYDLNEKSYTDATPGDFDTPPLDLGSDQDFCFSPDGQELAVVSNHTNMPAANTNNDIFLISLNDLKTKNLTADNQAVDNAPRYSPDGRHIAYKSMNRPGFEADQYEIILYNRETGKKQTLTESLDLSPGELVWGPDSRTLYFNTRERGRRTLYKTEINQKPVKRVDKHVNSDIQVDKQNNLYFRRQSNTLPSELFVLAPKGAVKQLTQVNAERLAQLELNPVSDFEFTSFDGKSVHGLMVKPPFFDPDKTYPLIYLIHGGPQGMWSDDFHYRWNSSMFAARGYVVAMVNFRGSKGYGQDWCDAVSKNWGGGPYQDLMAGLDYLLESYDFIDENRIAAAGASYGGFMINWIAGHTDRFDALVSHAGVFDQVSMYGATEELWFPEWEFGGTPYENPELYEKWSPSTHAEHFAKYKTPTLVIHGQHDYRVPVTQGFQMFTALQRMGVPSRLIYYPDETHFISKPQNARLWWNEIFNWIETWMNQ
ncbi:MAG: S9 family peptidase [candidate division KSB1 bacterium]|nr:S9 family peptidase [candidate division KSB1 bacterium]